MSPLERLAHRQSVGRLEQRHAVDLAFAAADLGAAHVAAGEHEASRSAVLHHALQRVGLDARDLTRVERGAATGLATLAYNIGRGRRA